MALGDIRKQGEGTTFQGKANDAVKLGSIVIINPASPESFSAMASADQNVLGIAVRDESWTATSDAYANGDGMRVESSGTFEVTVERGTTATDGLQYIYTTGQFTQVDASSGQPARGTVVGATILEWGAGTLATVKFADGFTVR